MCKMQPVWVRQPKQAHPSADVRCGNDETPESAMPLCNARVAIKSIRRILVMVMELGELRESVDGHDEVVMQIAWAGRFNDAVGPRRDADVVCPATRTKVIDGRPRRSER